MEHLEESLGLGFYPVGKINLPVRIASHATERFDQRFPEVKPTRVRDILSKGVPQLAQPNGHVELGNYLIIDQEDGIIIPIILEKNKRPGFERQTMGFIPTILDWKSQSTSEYTADPLLDKYHHLKKVYVENVSRWEIPHLAREGTLNGEPCSIIYV